MTEEEAARHRDSDPERTQQVIALILSHLQGHSLPLSLAELREMTGLRKSDLLRALAAAEQQVRVVPAGRFQWRIAQSGPDNLNRA
ncbi:hypothetical protein [Roseomonas elaeocarpi]|uniref:MarR family transcriptional regulator n=1 Tax=Roseomonas elaeocarpi TaxID=907779 RepID=A0ABV6JM19_9PROT